MIRTLLALAVLAVVVLALLVAFWTYQGRSRRSTPRAGLPAATELGTPLFAPLSGVCVGTTDPAHGPVAELGGRGVGTLTLYPTWLLVDRAGERPLWIPRAAVLHARTADTSSGTVIGGDNLLVVRWRSGEHEYDTGFRGEDRDSYDMWLTALGREVWR